jgi:hypothetical protein
MALRRICDGRDAGRGVALSIRGALARMAFDLAGPVEQEGGLAPVDPAR